MTRSIDRPELIYDADAETEDAAVFGELFKAFAASVRPFVENSLRQTWTQTEAVAWVETAGDVLGGLLEAIREEGGENMDAGQFEAAKANVAEDIAGLLAADVEPDITEVSALAYNLARFVVAEWIDALQTQVEERRVLYLNSKLILRECEWSLVEDTVSAFPIDEFSVESALRRFGQSLTSHDGYIDLPFGLYLAAESGETVGRHYFVGYQSDYHRMRAGQRQAQEQQRLAQVRAVQAIRRDVAAVICEPVTEALYEQWETVIADYGHATAPNVRMGLTDEVLPDIEAVHQAFYDNVVGQLTTLPDNIKPSRSMFRNIMRGVRLEMINTNARVELGRCLITCRNGDLQAYPIIDAERLPAPAQAEGERLVAQTFSSVVARHLTAEEAI